MGQEDLHRGAKLLSATRVDLLAARPLVEMLGNEAPLDARGTRLEGNGPKADPPRTDLVSLSPPHSTPPHTPLSPHSRTHLFLSNIHFKMQFFLQLAPLALLFSLVAGKAAPFASAGNTASCTTGSAQCCHSMVSDDAQKKALANLGVLKNLEVLIGVQCTAIAGGGGAVHSQCKSEPVCCQGTDNSGIVSRLASFLERGLTVDCFGCTPLSVN